MKQWNQWQPEVWQRRHCLSKAVRAARLERGVGCLQVSCSYLQMLCCAFFFAFASTAQQMHQHSKGGERSGASGYHQLVSNAVHCSAVQCSALADADASTAQHSISNRTANANISKCTCVKRSQLQVGCSSLAMNAALSSLCRTFARN